MRYEDASEMGSFTADQAEAQATLTARNDVDVILAGNYGPATGNTITGSGTISGSAGADMIAAGASITAIQGAGGTDTSFSGGKLQVAGEHGVLTIDAQGNYSYARNQGSPNGVSDVFSYTLASRDGGSDVANLTINIGKTPTVVQANAVQVVPGPDGVVTLPEGVQLSDIHVVGRNLVIDMPDGTQMIIVDGAVFVPQLVLGTVEVPSTNLAALLIDSEPTPAAGPPQSSGGNFAVPVGPLDPGHPLGDLIPPTALSYTPPEVIEVDNAVEEDDDNLVLITDLTPSVSGGDATVDEDDLPAGSDTAKESLTVGGNFTISAPDGVNDLTIGSLNVIVDGVFQAGASVVTPLGNTLTITGYNAATGVISYTYTLGAAETHASGAGENSLFENFEVTLTDLDGDIDTDTLSVNIVDDVPTANNDVAQLIGGGPISVTLDVDTNDVAGADGTASRVFASLTGTYGNLTLNPDGTQTYTLNAAGIAVMNDLPEGQSLTDSFNYTLTDGDGDSDPATLVITLVGNDHPVLITNLTPSAQGGEAIVDEDDLPDGSDTSKESLTVTGDFTISAPDGVDDLTVGGVQVIINGVFQPGATGLTPLGNTLTITGYNAATGVVSYSYTLNDNETHPDANGENSIFENLAVSLSDDDGDVDTDTLSIQIVDDVPVANDDTDGLVEGGPSFTDGNVITGAGTDGGLGGPGADVPGADGATVQNAGNLVGTHGTLVLNANGNYIYTLSAAGQLAIDALAPGATLTDTFDYTLVDGDGDTDPAQLVITLTGTDDPVVITGLDGEGAEEIVDEDDLSDGSSPNAAALTQTGTFDISAPDGLSTVTIGGVVVVNAGGFIPGQTIDTAAGLLSITGFTPTFAPDGTTIIGGTISYSYLLQDSTAHASGLGENFFIENFLVELEDADGSIDTASLDVLVIDDVPTANDDTAEIVEGDADNAITFDVDLNDVPGADGTASRNFTSLAGTYGDLTLNPDGTQTYTLNAVGMLAINALADGATLNDNFTYTLTDGDSDSDPANLVVTLQGTDDPVLITNLTPSANGGDAIVDEDDLADGSDTTKESLTVNGDFTISAPDGVNDLTVGGFNVIVDGAFVPGSHVTPLGNTLTFISYNPATGVISYSYTLLDNETHPSAADQNSIFEDFEVILTDADNDIDIDTLSVQIVDDVPTAVNDTANQVGENNPVVINAFANDTFGADGVDIDNNPTVAVTFTQPPAGQGSVSYNPATGLFTFTPVAGQQGSTSFTYTITDGDGDPSVATVTITLDADSVPIVTAEVARSDDDGLINGNPGGIGDIDANDGEEVVVNPSEAIFHGDIDVDFGGDTGTISFSNLHNTTGVVGTENVLYTWAGNTLTAITVGGTRPGTALFQIVVNNEATGDYTLTQLDNILHAAGGDETSVNVVLNYRAADSDGDVNTTGALTITFNDDTPTAVAAKTVTMSNAVGSGSNFLDADNDVDNNLGADGGNVIFTAASITALQAQNLTSGLSALNYSISADGTVLTATRVSDASTVFTIALQPVGSPDQYVVTIAQPLDAFEAISFDDGNYDFVGGNDAWAGFLIPGDNNSQDLLLTPEIGGVNAGTINSSAIAGGVGTGNAVGLAGGFVETFRVDFVTDLTGDPSGPGGYAFAGNRDHAFEGHYNTNGGSATFTATAGSTVKITAFQDADGNTVVGDGVPDPITQIVISYDGVSSGLITVTSTPTEYLVNGNTYTVTLNVDGSVTVGGIVGTSGAGAIGTRIAVFTDTAGAVDANPGYNSLEYSYVAGDEFKIGDFGAITISQDPVNFTVPISVQDADDDILSSGNLSISLTPPASEAGLIADDASDFSSMTLMASNDDQQVQQTQKIAANTNTVVLAAAVAAAGMAAETAAANDTNVGDDSALSAESQDVASIDDTVGSGSEETARSELGGETSEAAVEESSEASSSASSSDDQAAGGHSLTADNDVSPASQPVDLLEATEAPASVTVESIVAPMVSVPSAEALQAIAARTPREGDSVEQVVAAALDQAGPSPIDMLLANLPGGHDGLEAITHVRIPGEEVVPGWQMVQPDSPGAGFDVTSKIDVATFHHDAVQPTVNG